MNGFFYISKARQAIAVAAEKAANSAFATFASWIPTAEHMGPRTVAFKVQDFYLGFRTFLATAAHS
jgi:D-aminopeptidase